MYRKASHDSSTLAPCPSPCPLVPAFINVRPASFLKFHCYKKDLNVASLDIRTLRRTISLHDQLGVDLHVQRRWTGNEIWLELERPPPLLRMWTYALGYARLQHSRSVYRTTYHSESHHRVPRREQPSRTMETDLRLGCRAFPTSNGQPGPQGTDGEGVFRFCLKYALLPKVEL